ncbi:hypothetical protein QFZ34_000401 [Phyllobacterium ifriqiyense]|uniref:Uncharacterized protein n=1 Tax=Phyllobacterium ifriqiyense TaxID=314238 RepID=A0ABU0S389_9HYPH|nr:hypothetical protein [Phyllobacterium ifriqiyense]
MGTLYSEFIERLRRSVQEHEERILRLETGTEKRSGSRVPVTRKIFRYERPIITGALPITFARSFPGMT